MPRPPKQRTFSPAHLAFLRAQARRLAERRRGSHYLYEMTPAREKVLEQNIRKARRSPLARGSCFRHGLYSVSLRATILRAGESIEEYERHLALFRRAFRFPQEVHTAEAEAVIQAAGELVWRRLRAFRGFSRHAAQQLRRRLRQEANARAPSLARAARLADDVLAILTADTLALPAFDRVNRRLEDLLRFLLQLRGAEAPRFRILRPNYCHAPWMDLKPPALLHNPLVSARQWRKWQENNPRGKPPGARRLAAALARRKHRGFNLARAADREECLRGFERAFAFAGNVAEARQAGKLAWERLRCYDRHARWEAARVRRLLRRAVQSAPLAGTAMSCMAAALMAIFAEEDRVLGVATSLERRLRHQLRRLLRERERPGEVPKTPSPGAAGGRGLHRESSSSR